MADEYIQQYKIIFLGDQYVGKSSILNRFYQDKLEQDYQATIGLDFHSKNVYINGNPVRLLLYDIAGQEKFKSLIPMYIRDANIILVVYDITNKDSFTHTEHWVNEIKDLKREDAIFVLVGNKTDLGDNRVVQVKEAEDYATEKGFLFHEVSARTGENVEELFNNKIFPEMARKYNIGDEEEEMKKEKEEEEEEEEKEESENLEEYKEEENIEKKEEKEKCSLNEHEDINAKSFCQQCNIYMCSKCEKVHSGLLKHHATYNLDMNFKDIFTGLCKIKNHSLKLEYFCKDHNQLCCIACFSKLRIRGNGKHKNCKIFHINKIKKSKKNKLVENLTFLEELPNKLEQSINELKSLFEIINKNKENLKIEIQKLFTKIRNSLNDREDQLLLEVDKNYNDLFFKEELIKESEKLPKRIKISLEKGQKINNEWNDENKLSSYINDCLQIENNIIEINKIINESNSNKGIVIELNYGREEYHLLQSIKNFCNISHYDKLSSQSKGKTRKDKINEDEVIPQKLKTTNSVRNLKEDYSKNEKRLLIED